MTGTNKVLIWGLHPRENEVLFLTVACYLVWETCVYEVLHNTTNRKFTIIIILYQLILV